MDEDLSFFGLTEEDSIEELRKSYLNLALIFHPDQSNTDDKNRAKEEFIVLTKKYKNLLNFFRKLDNFKKIKETEKISEEYKKEQAILDKLETLSLNDVVCYANNLETFEQLWKSRRNDNNDYTIELNNGYDTIKSEYSLENLSYCPEINDFKVSENLTEKIKINSETQIVLAEFTPIEKGSDIATAFSRQNVDEMQIYDNIQEEFEKRRKNIQDELEKREKRIQEECEARQKYIDEEFEKRLKMYD